MNLSLLNSLCYIAGWLWCILFGVHGQPLLAALGVIFLIICQLYWTKAKNVALYLQDVLLMIFSIALGALLETFFIYTGLIQYASLNKAVPPIWIILLYALFPLLINHSLRAIKKNYFASFLFGFLGAPLSYLAERSLSALNFPYPLAQTWIGIGISWGVFFCILAKLANTIERAAAETLADRDPGLKFLYDGECPICNREICYLQKKDSQNKIAFIDIASKEYSPSENNNIDYKTAMSQIHAIENNGKLLIGIPAFASVYARCNLLVLSTLLRIPFIRSALNPLYDLFAKRRLWITGRTDIKK